MRAGTLTRIDDAAHFPVSSQICRRHIVHDLLVAVFRREIDDPLEQHVHEQKERLRLHHEDDRLVVGIVVEMLVHTGVLDDQRVARLPVVADLVVHVVTLALQHEKDRAVHMAVLLAIAARGVDVDMAFDRLRDLHRLRIDDLLAVIVRAALPLPVLGVIDARLREEFANELAIGALERADEDALLGPALPDDLFLLLCATIVAGAGFGRPQFGLICQWLSPSFRSDDGLLAHPAGVCMFLLSRRSSGQRDARDWVTKIS